MLNTSLLNLFQRQWLGVVDGSLESGANLIVVPGGEIGDPEGSKAQANAAYDLVGTERIDGVIVWTTPMQLYIGQQLMEEWCRRFEPLPIVSVEQVLPGATSLLMDNRSGMRDAVSHLIDVHGHTRIAFVRGPDNHPGAQDRYDGYLDALSLRGLAADPALVTTAPRSWEPADAAAAIGRIVDELPGEVDAVAAGNDDLALGVLAALRSRDLGVPADVAVVGFDDAMSIVPHELGLESVDVGGVALARAVNVSAATLPLTTVRAPFDRLGRRAVEVLLAKIRGEEVAEVEMVETELVVRRSCGCLTPGAGERVHATPPSRRAEAHASFRTAIETRRPQIVAELEQAYAPATPLSPPDWAEQLLTAFIEAVDTASADPFLGILDEVVREGMRVGDPLQSWWPVLFALRQQTTPFLATDGANERAESLWLRIQALMAEMADRYSAYRHLVAEKRDQIIRDVGQSVITAMDVDQTCRRARAGAALGRHPELLSRLLHRRAVRPVSDGARSRRARLRGAPARRAGNRRGGVVPVAPARTRRSAGARSRTARSFCPSSSKSSSSASSSSRSGPGSGGSTKRSGRS